ncbi:hypothetical protein [Pontibacter ruber]|uniref:SWFGD domain-containing protein n=1 Tax=Pontibacter ruber TaxID=1343895 RepID=A0ABW5CYL3_9BACT|nr:hypothetical protein [Pontibacter ruber]
MDRRDRDRHDRDDYRTDYGRHESYSRDDDRYHGARNLTNEFERHYKGDRDRWEGNFERSRRRRSYHEGNDLGDTYERLSRERGNVRSDTSYDMMSSGRDRDYSDSYDRDRNRDRDRYSNYQDDYRSYLGRDQDRDRSRVSGNLGQGYGASGRYNTYGSDYDRDRRTGQAYYSAGSDDIRSSGYRDRGDSGSSGHTGSDRGSLFSGWSSRSSSDYDDYGRGSDRGYDRGSRRGESRRSSDRYYDEGEY